MEGKSGGKRLAPEENKKKKRAALIAGGTVLGLLLAGYLALCAYAGSGGGRLAPNTRVGGAEVGGLSAQEAVATLDAALSQRLAALTVPFRCGEGLYSVPGTEFSYDAQSLVDSVSPAAVPFPARGWRFLRGMLDRDGAPVALTLDHVPQEVDRAAKEQGDADAQTTWELEDTAILITKGRTGRTVDTEGLMTRLAERASQALNAGESAGEEPVAADIAVTPPTDLDLEAIRREVYTEVSTAYLDRESLEIVPSVTGKDLEVEAARAALEKAAEGSTFRVELTLTEPEVSTEQLNESLFRDILGEATTRVTGTSDRKMNVGVAAEFINGTILFPGEEFSFNKVCSPYTVENGYGKATAYVNGLSKDTVAGGICQASSTLYWASLLANLETVERYAHRYEPSYVNGGLDATVYGDYGESGSLDFRFLNSTEDPIKIEVTMDSQNYIRVAILGTNTTGILGQPYSTNRVVTQTYQTIYQADETVPQGTTRADPERTGYNGVTWETYQRLVDAEGNTISETFLHKTKYYVRNEVIYFHPADLALWGIDPYTGLLVEPSPDPSAEGTDPTDPTATPDPTITDDPTVTTDPAVTEVPLPPPEASEDPVPPPEMTQTPGPVPEATPAPEVTLTPSDLPEIPAPGTLQMGW